MSRHLIALVFSATALSSIAQAEEPAPNAQALGTVEALVSFCAKADPASATKYQEQQKLIAQSASEKVLAEVRKSEDYRQARALVDESVGKLGQEDAKKTCSESLAENK
jgi:hypothetical protein